MALLHALGSENVYKEDRFHGHFTEYRCKNQITCSYYCRILEGATISLSLDPVCVTLKAGFSFNPAAKPRS